MAYYGVSVSFQQYSFTCTLVRHAELYVCMYVCTLSVWMRTNTQILGPTQAPWRATLSRSAVLYVQ